MLESAKDQFWRVDTPGQQVPAPVQYGMAVWVQGTELCRVYNCRDNRAYIYKWSEVLTGLVGVGLVMNGN
jgi:hypothetical protein